MQSKSNATVSKVALDHELISGCATVALTTYHIYIIHVICDRRIVYQKMLVNKDNFNLIRGCKSYPRLRLKWW